MLEVFKNEVFLLIDKNVEELKTKMENKYSNILEINYISNFLKDKKIRVNIGDKIFEGIAKNIVEDGRIEIEMDGEIKLFSVGEIKIEKDYY
mgnify:CR=1 FL=1